MIMLAIGEPQLLCDLEQNNSEFGQIEAEFLLDNPEIDKGLLKDLKRVSRPIPDDLDEDDEAEGHEWEEVDDDDDDEDEDDDLDEEDDDEAP